MEVGDQEAAQREESFNQGTEEVEINLSADLGASINKEWLLKTLEEKIRSLDEFARDKTDEQLVQIRVHQLALAKVSILSTS